MFLVGSEVGRVPFIDDLVILDRLFGNSGNIGNIFKGNIFDLGDLFVLDNLFNSTSLDPNTTSLGDILILNQLFNN